MRAGATGWRRATSEVGGSRRVKGRRGLGAAERRAEGEGEGRVLG